MTLLASMVAHAVTTSTTVGITYVIALMVFMDDTVNYNDAQTVTHVTMAVVARMYFHLANMFELQLTISQNKSQLDSTYYDC